MTRLLQCLLALGVFYAVAAQAETRKADVTVPDAGVCTVVEMHDGEKAILVDFPVERFTYVRWRVEARFMDKPVEERAKLKANNYPVDDKAMLYRSPFEVEEGIHIFYLPAGLYALWYDNPEDMTWMEGTGAKYYLEICATDERLDLKVIDKAMRNISLN